MQSTNLPFKKIKWSQFKQLKDFCLFNKEIHIWIVPFLYSPYKELYNVLSASEKLKAASFYTILLKNNYITGRGFLRNLLGLYLQLSPSILKFTTNEWGKPFLEKAQNHLSSSRLPIYFNLSNSGDFLIYAVTYASQVGIDLEHINTSLECDSYLISYSLNQEEQNTFYHLPKEKLLSTYLYIWTLKEAVLKSLGFGLSFPLHDLTVSLPPSEYAQVSIRDNGFLNGWFFYSFSPSQNYTAALASNQRNPQLKIFKVEW